MRKPLAVETMNRRELASLLCNILASPKRRIDPVSAMRMAFTALYHLEDATDKGKCIVRLYEQLAKADQSNRVLRHDLESARDELAEMANELMSARAYTERIISG